MRKPTLITATMLLVLSAAATSQAQTTAGCTNAQRAGESNGPARGQPVGESSGPARGQPVAAMPCG